MSIAAVAPDWEGLVANLRRQGTADRVYYFEHGIANNILAALDERYSITQGRNLAAATAAWDQAIAVHQYLGMEFFRVNPKNARMTVPLRREGGWTEEGRGPINSWAEFETFAWPDPRAADYRVLEHAERHAPKCMRAFHVLDLWEPAKDLFGFESFCFALYEQPDLVQAVFDRVGEFVAAVVEALCDFNVIGAIYIADDLGFKTAPFLPPDTFRKLVLSWHKRLADTAHAHGKFFFLHSCGQMYDLIDDYIDDIHIDAKHSFEDAVMPVEAAKQAYGKRLSLLGGMDVDLLARADEATIRARTRALLDACMPGGGYCLGSGNWVSDYIPPQHYLWMLDEARRWSAGLRSPA